MAVVRITEPDVAQRREPDLPAGGGDAQLVVVDAAGLAERRRRADQDGATHQTEAGMPHRAINFHRPRNHVERSNAPSQGLVDRRCRIDPRSGAVLYMLKTWLCAILRRVAEEPGSPGWS